MKNLNDHQPKHHHQLKTELNLNRKYVLKCGTQNVHTFKPSDEVK